MAQPLPLTIRRAVRQDAATFAHHARRRAGGAEPGLTSHAKMKQMGVSEPVFGFLVDGFSLHAAVRVEARNPKRLDQLCRYITRPALSDERVRLDDAGQVELKLKTPWRDGTTCASPRSGDRFAISSGCQETAVRQ